MMRQIFVAVCLASIAGGSTWAQEVFYPGNAVTLPTVVREVHLMGTADATVGIDCVVNADGTVGSATVVSSPNPILNDAAVRALRKWRFSPGVKNGQSVAVRIFVELSIERM